MFTYDPTTPRGQVRLLSIDFDAANASFADTDVDTFLTLNNGNVRLAAAQALDTLAAQAALVQGRTRFAGISMDGQVVADSLARLAGELRRQVYSGEDGTDSSPIDFAEMALDPFSYRERIFNEMLRDSG